MTVSVVAKSEDVDNLVRAIRAHANSKELRRELYAGINRAAKPVKGAMIEAIPAALPKRGGLAASVQGSTSAAVTAKSGKYAGVSIRFRSRGHDVRLLTGRRLRHPVYGNRNAWVTQTAGLNPAAFTGEFDKQAPITQREIVAALEDVARKVTNI